MLSSSEKRAKKNRSRGQEERKMKKLIVVAMAILMTASLAVTGCLPATDHNNDAIHMPTIQFYPLEGNDDGWLLVKFSIPRNRDLVDYLVETSIRTNEDTGEQYLAPSTITRDDQIKQIIVNSSYGWGHESPYYVNVGNDLLPGNRARQVRLLVPLDYSQDRNDGYFRGSLSVARNFKNAHGDTIHEETYIDLGPEESPRFDVWFGDNNDLIIDDEIGGSIIDFRESYYEMTSRPESETTNEELDTYILTTVVRGQGLISVDGVYQETGLYRAGQLVDIKALPSDGWLFDYWIINGKDNTSLNPAKVTMDSDVKVTAVFVDDDDPIDPGGPIEVDLNWNGEGLSFEASGQGSGVIGLELYLSSPPWIKRQVFTTSPNTGEAHGIVTIFEPNILRFSVIRDADYDGYVPDDGVIVSINGSVIKRDTPNEDGDLAYQVDVSTL